MAYDTSQYDELIKKYNTNADSNANRQIAQAKSSANDQLRQAYISNIQNQRQLKQNLAQSGIRGGMTESAQLNLQNQYGTQRGAVNSNLANQVTEINNTNLNNKNAYALETDSARRQYVENREAEDRANAREDSMINYERQTANLTAKYSQYYSLDKLKTALKSAKTPLEQQIINARIGYITQHKKGY